jgi:hypothetical protein
MKDSASPSSALLPPGERIARMCDAFKRAWRAQEQPRIEDFLWQAADSLGDDLLCQLIAAEVDLRRESGELVLPQEYVARFPGKPAIVEHAFEMARRSSLDDGQGSTASHAASTGGGTPMTIPEPSTTVPTQIGRYRVERILGSGKFGIVYLAYDPDLGRPVAIKCPHAERIGSAGDLDRYIEEARHAAQLKHPGIVAVYDVQREGDSVFVVQEFVAGQSLGATLKREKMTPARAAELLAAVAEAVSFAHRQGLVHRDLKPDNILVDSAGTPHVADFGLALHESLQSRKRGERAGSPAYMSPEQVQGLTHRLDGRSDIWSLGVILYEMLTGRCPFRGHSRDELYDEILEREPRPPRQIEPAIPAELERVCFKCLSKRMSDRYSTATDLASDLRQWESAMPARPATSLNPVNPEPQATALPANVIPKGLRSFDAQDANFFLDLLPGPRDRDGLPDSIRFWKTRIEDTDPDNTFSVGLIYGPSGCGKSSLVKAGLLPRLASHVISVYVEATEGDTEARLLSGIKKRVAGIPATSSLLEAFECLREGRGLRAEQKVFVVLDQFEQWLHTNLSQLETELVQALRHCDGQHVQCVVMVRDDFWLAVSRFMQALEVDPVPGKNSTLVDLFDPGHARKVLSRFGQAYLALPDREADFTTPQCQFLDDSLQALSKDAQDGKIICVRLSLFADMVKGKPWTPDTLRSVGGAEGIGVTFLEETFGGSTAAPKHRLHQKAARAVLQALLPESGSEIKGGRKSRDDLAAVLKASNCPDKPRDLDDLLRILDGELRLITPTEEERQEVIGDRSSVIGDQSSVIGSTTAHHSPLTTHSFYQLTHDYLVPSLREWLTRKQKETWRGRAELRLEELASQWSRARQSRLLPNPLEFAYIMAGVPPNRRGQDQQQMMHAAGRRYSTMTALLALALSVVGWAVRDTYGRLRADGIVLAIRGASIDEVQGYVAQLKPYRPWAAGALGSLRSDESEDVQLKGALAMLPADTGQVRFLQERLLSCRIQHLRVILEMLREHAGPANKAVQNHLRDVLLDGTADSSHRFNAALALATYDPDSSAWNAETAKFVVDRLVASGHDYQPQYRAALDPSRHHLVDACARATADAARDTTQRLFAAWALSEFGRDQPETVARALFVANEQQYRILLESLRRHPEKAIEELNRQLDAPPERVWPTDVDVSEFGEPARDLVAKIENAAGLVERHFAFCQTLPLADFAALTEALRPSGYRPTRLRPYFVARPSVISSIEQRSIASAPGSTEPGVNTRLARSLDCAVVWQRDGHDWRFQSDLSAESLYAADQDLAANGFEPVDVAPYVQGTEMRYAALWGASSSAARPLVDGEPSRHPSDAAFRQPARPVFEVGLKLAEYQKKLAAEFIPMLLQVATHPIDSEWRIAVIWQKKDGRREVAATLGGESNLLADAGKYADRTALDVGVCFAGAIRGKRDQAREDRDRITQNATPKAESPESLMERGLIALNLGEDERAVEMLTKVSAAWPAPWYLAIAQARLGNVSAASQAIVDVGKFNPSASWACLAVVVGILGKDAEGFAKLEREIRDATDGWSPYFAACAYALVAEHMEARSGDEKKHGLTDAERADRVAEYKRRAVALLNRACDAGFSDETQLRTDWSFESLRGLEGFQAVAARLGPGRRYTAIWSGLAASPVVGADNANVLADKRGAAAPRMESIEIHGFDVRAQLGACRELISSGFRLQSLSVVSHPLPLPPLPAANEIAGTNVPEGLGHEALFAASVWARPQDWESKLDDSARRNGVAAVAMVQLGVQHKACQILQHAADPRARSYWLHYVRPMGVNPETLIDRFNATRDDKEKFGLLQALGEYEPPEIPVSVRGHLVDQAKRIYRDTPRRDLLAASRWLLGRWGEQGAVAEIDAGRKHRKSPADGFEWFTNGLGMTMIVIPAGEYLMGSSASEPDRHSSEIPHRERITRPFTLADREVTVAQFSEFYRAVFNQSWLGVDRISPSADNGPAVLPSWFEALAFCRWMSDREGIDSERNCLPPLADLVAAARQAEHGQPVKLDVPKDFLTRPGYRLPTEAEWEYACRAGATTRFNFGNDAALLDRYTWFAGNSGRRTRPCALLKPNDWGLHDMHGNVSEWCMDLFRGYEAGPINSDSIGPPMGLLRVLRGGSYIDPAGSCRSATRNAVLPAQRVETIGFRVAASLYIPATM